MELKLTEYLVLICFIIALLTFGSGESLFYLFWSVSVLISSLYIFNILSKGKINRQHAQIFILLAIWMVYALLITPWTTNSHEHLKILLLSFIYTLYSIICAIIIGKHFKRFIKYMELALMAWLVVNLIYLLLYYTGIINYGVRSFSGVYFNRNNLATTGLLFFIFILFLKADLVFLKTNFRFGIVLLSLIILILSTQSSKGFIGIILISVLFLVSMKDLKKLMRVTIIILGSLLLMFLILDLDSTLRVKKNIYGFLGINKEFEPGSISASGKERNFLMNQGFKVAMENPLTGVGVNNSKFHLFPESYYRRLAAGHNPESGMVSHNNYVEMLLNGGIPAFFLYYIPIIYLMLLLLIKNRNNELTINNLRKYFIISIFVKLIMDIGMVNYMNFPYLFIIASSFVFYYNYLRYSSNSVDIDSKVKY